MRNQQTDMIKIVLPDQSVTYFDESAFKFTENQTAVNYDVDFSGMYEVEKLVQNLQSPSKKFGQCFRRLNDAPRYSSIQVHYDFDFTFLENIYSLKSEFGYGGMFSSSHRECAFLDGKIITHQGYGWGSQSWTALEGYQALRVVCLLFGIEQPRSIKGETDRIRLCDILFKLNDYIVKDKAFSMTACPWQIN
jgi:hypothetical protein